MVLHFAYIRIVCSVAYDTKYIMLHYATYMKFATFTTCVIGVIKLSTELEIRSSPARIPTTKHSHSHTLHRKNTNLSTLYTSTTKFDQTNIISLCCQFAIVPTMFRKSVPIYQIKIKLHSNNVNRNTIR